ncbi:MAG: DUF362 domain-containing protein [Magnetococcales bacterium]|nr:DUF362 domain-containing protein [Magnetococcales bacterium]
MAKKEGSDRNRVDPPLNRRQFIKRLAGTSGLALGLGVGGALVYSDKPIRRAPEIIHTLNDFRVPPSDHHPMMAVVRGSDAETMVREAVAKLGGISRFISRGERVLLKPNVGWDRLPEQAANTGPEVVGAVAKLCREAGAGEVWVTDVSLNDPYRSFARSGIEQSAIAAGAQVRIPGQADFWSTDLGGELLGVWPVSRFFHEVDRVINLPIIKNHSLCGCTLAMKNWYGVLGGRRNQLHQKIHTSIVDLARAVRPTLTIMDGIRVLKENGPTGGSLSDVVMGHTVVAGLDEVAMDSFALGFLELTPEEIPFLTMAEKAGLGQVDWQGLNWTESKINI